MKRLLTLCATALLWTSAGAAIGTPTVGTVTYEAGAGSDNIDCALSGVSTTAGNLLLCVAHAAVTANEPSGTAPSGWTTVYQYDQLVVYGKISSGSETDPTITFAGTTGVKGVYAISMSGTHQTIGSILDGTTGEAGASETNLTYPSYTPGNSGTACLVIGQKANVSWTNIDVISGYTELLDDVSTLGSDISLVVDYELNCGSLTGGTLTVLTGDATGVTDTIALGINVAASPPSFSAAPAADTLDASGFNIDATADADSTLYCVAQHPAVATPNATQVKAGNNGAGSAAIEAQNSALTSGVSGTVHFTGLASWPVVEVHCVVSNAGGDSAVSSIADQERGARSGFSIVRLTSVSTTSICDQDSYFDPDVAASDYIEVENTTNENSYNITFGADCDFSYDAGGDTSRQSFDYCPYDYSAAAAFTTPSACDDTIWVNNQAPSCIDQGAVVLDHNSVMSSTDICAQWCSDFEADSLSATLTSGTLPAGVSLGGTGNCTLSGTPTLEDETGASLLFTITDTPGDTGAVNSTFFVVDTVTMPTLTSSDLDAAIAAELAAFPWRTEPTLTATFKCDNAEAANQVLTQSPAAAAEVAYDAAITIEVSAGATCNTRRRRGNP